MSDKTWEYAAGEGVNERKPNFTTAKGDFYLTRCFACEPARGRENWAMAVSSGQCAFCGAGRCE